jgi:glycosyltransferase involved in cell wall biosynthesis
MKLLICTQALDKNDSNLGFFHQWVEEFSKHCEKVIVICLREGAHTLSQNIEVLSLGGSSQGTVHKKSMIYHTFFRVRFVARFYVWAWRRRHEYDAVFVHMNPEYIVLMGPLWRLWGKRVGLWYAHKSVTVWLRIALQFTTVVCTVAPDSFRVRTPKLHAIGHGIDVERFKPGKREASSALRIGTTGRIAASKHRIEMLAVLDVLHARGIPFQFSVAGAPVSAAEESYAKDFERELSVRPYKNVVQVLGAIPHTMLPKFLREQDVFLNFATTGNMDKAGLEALAAGVPVVSSNESFKTFLEPYGLFAALNAPERLADAVERASRTDVSELRSTVEREHSLAGLIPRIVSLLS